jgi:acyl-CoA thioester hydrolase
MAYVYYGYYSTYYEVARVEALRKLGLTYREVEAMGIIMPVLENHSKFHAPGKYDELLRIVTTIREKPTVRIRFEYAIFNGENKLIHEGETLLAFVDQKTGRPTRPPKAMMDVLDPFFK